MKPIVLLMALVMAAAVWGGCGTKKETTLTPKSPWDEKLAEYFDDSVDFTINPQELSGQWLFKYQDQLAVRMIDSELVLGIKVISVTQKTDPEGKACKDLYTEVKARVKGKYEQDTVTLRVCDDAAGYDSFKEDDTRLYERVYIAYIKLYKQSDGEVGLHWHLSPLSKGLKEGMDKILSDSKSKKGKDDSKKYVTPND